MDFKAIASLVSSNTRESSIVEFKEHLPKGDADKKAFLKHISAFANGIGGHLIYGIKELRDRKEKLSRAGSVVLFKEADLEAARSVLQSWASSSISPRLPGLKIYSCLSEQDHSVGVLVAYVPQSWIGPHQNLDGYTFHIRTNTGSEPMLIDQVRNMCLSSAGTEQKIRAIQTERLNKIIAGHTPTQIMSGPFLTVFAAPLSSTSHTPMIMDLRDRTLGDDLRPSASRLMWTGRYNLDGYVSYNFVPSSKEAMVYVQIFRNAQIEYVTTHLSYDENREGEKTFSPYAVHGQIECAIELALSVYRKRGVSAPAVFLPAIFGIKGAKLDVSALHGHNILAGESAHSIDRDCLLLPEILIDDLETSVSSEDGEFNPLVRGTFDALWQAGGRPEAIPFPKRRGR